jgi:hypothetical protein
MDVSSIIILFFFEIVIGCVVGCGAYPYKIGKFDNMKGWLFVVVDGCFLEIEQLHLTRGDVDGLL